MTSEFHKLPQSFQLLQLEKLVYSENRADTYNELFPNRGESSEKKFLLCLFAQLDLEKSFNNEVHLKFKRFYEYLQGFESWVNQTRGGSRPREYDSNYKQIHAKHALLQLQQVLIDLGASDDEVEQLNVFHESSVDNLRELHRYFKTTTDDYKGAVVEVNSPEYLSATAPTCQVLVRPSQVEQDQQRAGFFKQMIDIMSFYYSHSMPEQSSSSGFNTYSHLLLNDFISRHITSTLPAAPSNPIAQILHAHREAVKYPTRASAWISSFSTASYPLIFQLIEANLIDPREMTFFPSLQTLLSTPVVFDSSELGEKHLLLELIAIQYETAHEMKKTIEAFKDDYKNQREHKYYPYYSSGLRSNWGDLAAQNSLSYDQLLIIRKKIKSSLYLAAQPGYLQALLSKFVPINFLTMLNNQDVGVMDPYKQTPFSSARGFYPTRHVLDTPIIIMKVGELEGKKSMIPSYLLTAMNIYEQLLDIIKTARKGGAANDVEKGQLEQYYFTCLASYLQYTAKNNVWRFDLFDNEFVPAPLVWHGYLYEKTGTLFKSKNKEPTISMSRSNIPGSIFPTVSFETIFDMYLRQYFELPFVTSWKTSDLYKDYIVESELQSRFFEVKVQQSQVIVDLACDQAPVLANDVAITGLASMSAELANVQSQLNKTATFVPKVSIFDNKLNYAKDTAAIQERIQDAIKGSSPSYYATRPQQNTTSLLNWSTGTQNKYVIDVNGNIRTALSARNLTNITINVYHLDIFTYYQSQLGKPGASGTSAMEVDPNIDLEGLIPHYTSTIDMAAQVQAKNDIKPWQIYNINLCLDNIPARGVFMLEVLNGQDGIRCCVRKGMFNTIMKPINAGTLVLVLDEAGQPVNQPRVYIGTDVFKPLTDDAPAVAVNSMNDDVGVDAGKQREEEISSKFIFIPSYESTKTLLLTDKAHTFASTAILEPVYTSFSLSCDWFASVEALTSNTTPTNETNESNTVVINGVETNLRTGANSIIGGGNMGAEVLLKPVLQKNGKIIDLSTVTIVKSTLSISAELESGVTITDQVDSFQLTAPPAPDGSEIPTQEVLHSFNVPNNLCRLTFRLNCTVEFEGKEHDLSSSYSQTIAAINKTSLSSGMILLRRVNGIYFAYTVDKTGSPIPFVPLQFSYSSKFVNSVSTYTLHSDLNGCVELGTLFGVNQINLTTTTTEYTFIRTNFSFNLLPYQRTMWASSINVIVDDSAIDKTPANSKSITIDDAQVNLPLPLGLMFDSAMVDFLLECAPGDLEKYNITSANAPHKLATPPTQQQQIKMLQWVLRYGGIRFYEKTAGGSPRQLCHHLLQISPSSVQVYGLKPNRNYHLEVSLFGEEYSTSIRTFRNPLTRPLVTPQQSFGTILPQPLFYDATLNSIFDYLITTSSIYQIKDYSKQLAIQSFSYDSTQETMKLQLSNYNPKTTKIVVFATTLISTIPELIDVYAGEQGKFYDQAAASISDSRKAVKEPESFAFVTGTTISGEREYVSLRRDLIKTMKQVGIMLPQPSLLLNKRLRQNTDAIIDKPKEAAKGGSTMSLSKEKAADYELESSSFGESMKRSKIMSSRRGPSSASSSSYYSSNQHFPSNQSDNTFIATDIMKYKSSFLFNISPDEDGKVVIKRNGLNKYTSLVVLAYETKSTLTNSYGFNSLVIDIPQSTTRLPYTIKPIAEGQNIVTQSQQPSFVLDNAFTLTLQPHKQYTEEHRCGIIQPTAPLYSTSNATVPVDQQSSTVIGPNNSVELEIITSRQDLYAMLSSLLQSRGSAGSLLPRRNYTGDSTRVQTALNKFRFLQEWNGFNDAMKLTMLDRQACHELHLFIFFNDRAFFESALRLHLSNKLTKDVCDLWLLSQAVASLSTLNAGLSTAQVQAVQDNIEIFNAIKDESRAQLMSYSTSMATYNVFEKTLILSLANPAALHSLALQVQQDVNLNPSLSRNNLAYVTIFESCLRRTMLRLNTAEPDAVGDDESDDDSNDRETAEEVTMNDDEPYRSTSASDSDHDCDDGDVDYNRNNNNNNNNNAPKPTLPRDYQEKEKRLSSKGGAMPAAAQSFNFLADAPSTSRSGKLAEPPQPQKIQLHTQADRSRSSFAFKKVASPTVDSLASKYQKDNKPSSIPSYKPLEKTGEYEERTWYNDAQFDGQRGWSFNSLQAVQWSNYWVDFALYLSDPSRFSVDNDNSSVEKTNKAFASAAILDLIEASETEYLLCLAVTQLSPTPLAKQALLGAAKGAELSTPLYNYLATSHNSTTPDVSALGNVQQGARYRYVRHASPKFPIVILHKQVQQLSAPKSSTSASTTTTATKDVSKSLSAAQYYIDVFESIQKNRAVYVTPDQMFKRRAYLCKTVISNMSPESVSSKVLVTVPDGSTSLSYTPSDNHRNGSNQTHLNTLTTRTIYCSIPAYSSYIIQYSFLLGNRDQYTHYGATVTSTNSAVSQLYCFVPSIQLKCSDYKQIINRRDVVTIAREASDDELCEFLAEYYFNDAASANQSRPQDGEERQRFDLGYILFRFNGSGAPLAQRYSLYMRIYTIVKGWLINNITSSEARTFISYMYYFFYQSYSTTKPLQVAKQHTANIAHAWAYLIDSYIRAAFSFNKWQHLEYLPLVAARIHNSSISPNANKAGGSLEDKDPFIPDRQLKEQYINSLQYVLVHSSNVANIPYQQLLSLIYYAIVLNQNIRVISLLKHLLNTLSKQSVPNVTTRVQLAYLLIYIDVSTYGTLQSVLSVDQLKVLNTIYKSTAFTQVKDVGYKQATYAVALILSREYQRYPIKQWKLLFVQALQYLKEGQVIVTDTTMTDQDTTIIATDFDPNVAGASVAQRDLRQDQGANSTPALSCNVQQTLTHTNVVVSFSNLVPTETHLTFDIHYIDSELLLSHKPFMTSQQASSTSHNNKQSDQITRPHLSLHIPLPPETRGQRGVHSITVPIPAHLSKEAQLTIVARETQITSTTPLLHSAFVVQVLSKQGIVSVLDSKTHKPISGVYVKCYLEGASAAAATFHHDCYTDLRGKADYASSSNSSKSANNQSFAIIISHPQYGTTVSYTRGPQF